MHRVLNATAALVGFLLFPSIALAQATIAGTVRDASSAVLPGVTVEAASRALIQKVRTVVSDGTGQYRITDLPPGTYVVTFSLQGFTTVRRDGLPVSGSGVITVNVDLRIGELQETITVSGEASVVDTQSVRREVVLNADTLNSLPATRGYGSALAAVPSLNIGGVAGAGATTAPTTPQMMFFTAHGGASGEGRVMTNGLTVAAPFGGGGVSDVTYDIANAEEMQVLISGGLGEAETGGPSINIVPKSGGNQFNGSAFYSTSGDWATSNNVDDRLRGFGITQPPTLRTNWDASVSLGGPIVRDRLWFFGSVRNWGNAAVVTGIFANRYAGDASRWNYLADPSIEARQPEGRQIYAGRFTAQATPRNRVTFSYDYQRRCGGSTLKSDGDGCRQAGTDWIGSGRTFGADTVSPETFPGYHDFPYHTVQATYSAPISSRTLIEGGYSRFVYGYGRFGMAAPDGLMDYIPVTEQTGIYGRPNFSYRGVFDPLDFGFNDNDALNSSWRAAVSYVTGAHNFKIGYTGSFTEVHNGRVPNNTQLRYTFNANAPATTPCTVVDGNRLCPIAVSYFLAPRWNQHDRTQTLGLYAQDQWTIGRLTLQGGLRYDRAWSWAPADGNGTTGTSRFNPQPISFERTVSVRGYNDITPRFGIAYDLFGNGRTALKVNGGKYLEAATSDAIYSSNNPAARIITRVGSGPGSAARGWTDGNQNFMVDCDLLNPALQNNLASGGDLCAALGGVNLNFGNANPNTTTINPDILGGWGVRPYDWQLGASVQHELLPRLSVEAGYNRRWWGNFFVTDNVLTSASDYDVYAIAIPQHEHLPGGGSTASFAAITPAASARGAQSYMTKETDFGDARTAYWHGVDFTARARLANGLTVQAGTSTGRAVRDMCDVTRALPELLGTARVDSCDVTEKWATSFRGLATYTVPKVDVLVSASMRSIETTPGGGVATNGLSLAANYVVPNTVIQESLGRLPANALATGTTTVNLLKPGELYTLQRVSLVDMRFAKIFRFAGRRADVGIDLYNLFNSNVTTAYQQTYEFRTNGAAWLTPTGIAAPRLARFHVTLNY
ncbi:MAG: TonB-dependent receptor [Gemmatimonadetes bacterium]|nr:TonB-dependent receptor [Gemmatimonadota bacterium]